MFRRTAGLDLGFFCNSKALKCQLTYFEADIIVLIITISAKKKMASARKKLS